MATTAAKAPAPRTSDLKQFTWEGTDKRGVKMKGETDSKNANLLKAELRKQGINPTTVRAKGATTPASCQVVYTRSAAANTPPGITSTLTNCN